MEIKKVQLWSQKSFTIFSRQIRSFFPTYLVRVLFMEHHLEELLILRGISLKGPGNKDSSPTRGYV